MLDRVAGTPPDVDERDLEAVAVLYGHVFAGEPWNEYTICPQEGIFFGCETESGDVCLTPGCEGVLRLAYPRKETISYIRRELEFPHSALFLLRDRENDEIIGFSWGFSYPTVESFAADKYTTLEMRVAIVKLLYRFSIGVDGVWYLSESGIKDDPRYRGKGWSTQFHLARLAVAQSYGLDAIQRTRCDGPMYLTSRRTMTQILGPQAEVEPGTRRIRDTGNVVNDILDIEMPARALFAKQKAGAR